MKTISLLLLTALFSIIPYYIIGQSYFIYKGQFKTKNNIVGIFSNNIIYKSEFQTKANIIGKYSNGIIYKKEYDIIYNIIGSYDGPDYVGPAAAILLLLK